MEWLSDAGRVADRIVDHLVLDSDASPFFDSMVVRDTICGVPVLVGVIDVNPEAEDDAEDNPHWSPADAWFTGWSELLAEMQEAYDDHAYRGRPSLRLVIPSDALVGGIRPHDTAGQPFRLDWIVGAPGIDRVARLVWQHGRELLPLLTRSAIVPGSSRRDCPQGVRSPEPVAAFVSSCSWSNAVVGFGGVDLAVWALAGVRDPRRLIHDTLDDGLLSEVVELADAELYGPEPNGMDATALEPRRPGGTAG